MCYAIEKSFHIHISLFLFLILNCHYSKWFISTPGLALLQCKISKSEQTIRWGKMVNCLSMQISQSHGSKAPPWSDLVNVVVVAGVSQAADLLGFFFTCNHLQVLQTERENIEWAALCGRKVSYWSYWGQRSEVRIGWTGEHRNGAGTLIAIGCNRGLQNILS